MYRLKFRKSAAGFFAIIIGVVLILATPFVSVAANLYYDLPISWIAPAQAILPLLFALIHYRSVPFTQQVRAFLVTASLIALFGCLANGNAGNPPVFGFFIIQHDWLLHFHAVILGIMNLAGLIAAINFMQAEQMSSFVDTKVAEAQLERLKAVKVDPDTQAKWEKAAAYADRSADGRSLRSTMTNLKAISLAEPGQELKPTVREREPAEKDKPEKAKATTAQGDDGSLANLLERMDDMPLVAEGGNLSAVRSKPALSGNSFINDVPEAEAVDSGGSFLDKMLNARLDESEAVGEVAATTDLGLPAEEAETIDVAALLDSFPDESAEPESQPEPALSAGESQIGEFKPEPFLAGDKFEAKPKSTQQFEKLDVSDTVETTRTSSFANASSSRNSLPALQPLEDSPVESQSLTAETADSPEAATFAAASPAAAAAATASTTSAASTSPTNLTGAAGAPASSPTNTNNKLAAMKRRNTSTFTKLNALSASGTGNLTKSPTQDAEAEPDSLRSLLDRLDDDKEVVAPAPKIEEIAKPIEPPVELVIDTVFRDDGTLESAPTPQAAAPAAKVEAPAQKAAEPAAKEAEPEAAAAVASAVEEPVAEVEAPVAKQEEPAARLEEPAARLEEPAARLEEPAAVADETFSIAEELTAKIEEPAAFFEESLVPPALDSVMASESDADAAPLASLLERSLGGLEEEEEQAPAFESLAAPAEETAPALALLEEPEEDEGPKESLFGSGVDSDIDNIFSELAPPEAQLEVKDAKPVGKAAIEEEEPAHSDMMPSFSASESLFAGGVDSDIDNIFLEMAPDAAQDKLSDFGGGSGSGSGSGTTHGDSLTGELVKPSLNMQAAAKEATAKVEAPQDELPKVETPKVEALKVEPAIEEAADEEGGAEPTSGLFGGGIDSEIDDIFSELAPPEAQKEVRDRTASGTAAGTPAASAQPAVAETKTEDFTPAATAEAEPEAEEAASEGGLFGDDLGQELDSIFSGLTESAQLEVNENTLAKVKTPEASSAGASPKPAMETPQAQTMPPVPDKPVTIEVSTAAASSAAVPPKPEAPKYKEVKEFGRLSAKPMTSTKFAGDTAGTMKTIGKLLLDVQAVENIIKSGETRKIGANLSTAKVISAARGEGIKAILMAIDTYEGVAGSLIVGHDGLVIASTVGTGWDKDMLGALSTALLSTSNLATKKLEIGKLRQMVLLTNLTNGDGQQFKTTVLTDVDVGILAVFLEKTDLKRIDGLLETIHTTIHGG